MRDTVAIETKRSVQGVFCPDRTLVTVGARGARPVGVLSDNAPLYTYDCPLCAPTKTLVDVGDRRVSNAVKRNALELSLQ